MNYKIYGLATEVDPDNIRYIGYTKQTLNQRLQGHKDNSKKEGKKNKKQSWFCNKLKRKIKIIIILLEDKIDENEIDNKEIQYIKLYKSFGAKLVNGTSGGGGAKGLTAWNKGLTKSDSRVKAYAEKVSKSKKGCIPWNIGIPRTNEVKLAVSKANKGKISPFRKKVKVINIENNNEIIFDSLVNCSKELSIPTSSILYCIKKSKTRNSFNFTYL